MIILTLQPSLTLNYKFLSTFSLTLVEFYCGVTFLDFQGKRKMCHFLQEITKVHRYVDDLLRLFENGKVLL